MLIQIGFNDYVNISSLDSFDDLIDELNDLLGENTYTIEKNGKRIDCYGQHELVDDEIYKVWPKVLGGKGGFGSLLRSFGKQILISKNKEACRDLNGRRIRDVNNEKKLKEWMQKEMEQKSQASASASKTDDEAKDYRNVPPPHKFSDAAYDEQKRQIADNMEESVKIAADLLIQTKKKKKSSTAVSTNDVDEDDDDDADKQETKTTNKRRHSEDLEDGEVVNKPATKSKGAKNAFFVGVDLGDISDLDDDDDDDEDEESIKPKNAKKKKI